MNVMIQARVNEHTKKEAEKILNQLGLSLSDGLRMFLHQVTINRGMPFRPMLDEEPNERVQKAMRNALAGDTERIGGLDDFKKMYEAL